jgi:transcriptional regulator with XRE-family HTH domain
MPTTLQILKGHRKTFHALKRAEEIRSPVSPVKRPPKPKSPRLVAASYGQRLRAEAKAAGIGWEALAERAGISSVSAWRVEDGKGSLKSALALRDALVSLGRTIEPPVVSLGEGPLEEWTRLGEKLYAADREAFDDVLARVRDVVKAQESVDAGISLIAHPLPSRRK